MKPVYVVSQDLDLLLPKWKISNIVPVDLGPFRDRLTEILSFGDHEVVNVSSKALLEPMRQLVRWSRTPVISVDPVYAPTQHMLHVTRSCRADQSEISTPLPRFGHASVDLQLQTIARELGANLRQPVSVALVDDVVFTGSLVEFVNAAAARHGLLLKRVIAGIAITDSDGCEEVFSRLGIELTSVFDFPRTGDGPVIDEICERDFFVFSAMCGRSLASMELSAGFPYIEPYGDAARWASFGEKSGEISKQLIELNIDLLRACEIEIGLPIRFSELVREPLGVRRSDVKGERIINHLQRELE